MTKLTPSKEDFLHFIWRKKRFDHIDLKTTDGQSIQIIDYGIWNKDAGPDFSQAKIKIANHLWIGNVEIHIMSSAWNKHLHQEDPRYNSTILHVVWQDDATITNQSGSSIPTLELNPRVDESLIIRYHQLIQGNKWIPCQEKIHQVPPDKITLHYYGWASERLRNKAQLILKYQRKENVGWEEILYQQIGKYLGQRVNSAAMENLTTRTPLKILYNYKDQPEIIEAILFGQSGLIQLGRSDYEDQLCNHYIHYKIKYKLKPMTPTEWKFMRLRPPSFPTIRIAQLAAWLCYKSNIFDTINSQLNYKFLIQYFQTTASTFWDNHYRFEPISDTVRSKNLGKNSIDIILINAVIPVIYAYGISLGDDHILDQSVSLLENIPSESNSIIKTWKGLGLSTQDALGSQALLELKNSYCNALSCLKCPIGNQIMGNGQ